MKLGFTTVCLPDGFTTACFPDGFPEGPVYILSGDAGKEFERLRQQNAELLEALTDLWAVSHWPDNPYEMDAAKLAIAKATGEE